MTNDEIWEWMQRDLDGDLSLAEQNALYSLLRKDSDLQLQYNRLKTVSQKLEQLPPVVPSFSIVDSILPQLESAAAKPAAAFVPNEEILPTLEVKRNLSLPSDQKKWKRMKVWLASIGSTAAAACLLIGILFTGSDGKKTEPDLYQHGTETVAPTAEQTTAPVLGPPPPPPRTNPSPSNTAEEDKKTAQTPSATKKQNTKKAYTPSSKNSASKPAATKPPGTKPAVNRPAVPLKPVAREEKPPAFPYGLEEKSDSDDKDYDRDKASGNADRDKSEEKDKDKKEKENEKD